MEVKNNPSGRLYDILVSARHQPDNIKLRAVWANVFGCEQDDTGEILRLLADLFKLVHEAREATSNLNDVDSALYLEPFNRIENLLAHVNLNANWQGLKGNLDEKTMTELRFGADRLSRLKEAQTLSSDQTSLFTQQLEELLQAALSSELPPELKRLFSKNIECLRHALFAYKISGADGIEDEIDRALGSLLRYKDDIKKSDDNGKRRALFQRFFEIISKLNEAISLGQNTTAIAPPAIALLAKIFS